MESQTSQVQHKSHMPTIPPPRLFARAMESASETDDTDTEEEDAYSDGPNDPGNYMLNALHDGMSVVHSMARKTLAACNTEKSHDEAVADMKSYTLKLLRKEKTFTESFNMCTQIIDEIVAEDENAETENDDNGGDHNWDKNPLPLFSQSLTNECLTMTRERMNKKLDDRMSALETSLTDDKLKTHPRFVSLQKEIELGSEDFEENFGRKSKLKKKSSAGRKPDVFLAVLENSESGDRQLPVYDEEEFSDGDGEIEYMDPITHNRIRNPVRNQYCRHVFERDTIQDFINANPDSATCPVDDCSNILKMEDFL